MWLKFAIFVVVCCTVVFRHTIKTVISSVLNKVENMTKRFFLLASLALSLFLAAPVASCRTIEIRSSQCGSRVASGILERLKAENPAQTDTVVLFFDQRGDIVINRTIELRCHTEIKGLGEKKTRVLAREELKTDGSSTLTDDCFISIKGRRRGNLSVNIHDINISLAKHKGMLWGRRTEKLLIKICDASRMNVKHFTTHSDNAACTNLDLRGCSNVEISECTFENYNNCRISGCLWMRGGIENVRVHHNRFYKHGNDEILAFYHDWNHGNKNDLLANIEVSDNEFVYANAGGCEDMPIDVMFNLGGSECDKPYLVNNLQFINNKITLDVPCHTVFGMSFNKNGRHRDFVISGNTIISTAKRSANGPGCFQFDFDIRQQYIDLEHPVVITGNKIVNEAQVSNQWSERSGYVINNNGGNIEFTNNEVTSTQQMMFLKAMPPQGTILVEGNTFDGLAALASIADVDNYKLEVVNNKIDGKSTSIYSNNVAFGEYIFNRNECQLSAYDLFLIEAPATVEISYCGNDVACSENCVLYSNYSGKTTNVSRLRVENNTFRGVGQGNPLQSLGNMRATNSSVRDNQLLKY